jgi:hypothetical protein
MEWSNHTHVVLWISPFVGEMIKSHKTTCVWFYHFTYKWTYPQNHMCVILSFHLQMDLPTIPHVCDFIIPPTNGLIHNTTCVWFYHSTYKWTYPQYHVCVILSFHLQMDLSTFVWFIPPTIGHIHNNTCIILSFYLPLVGGMITSHTCG